MGKKRINLKRVCAVAVTLTVTVFSVCAISPYIAGITAKAALISAAISLPDSTVKMLMLGIKKPTANTPEDTQSQTVTNPDPAPSENGTIIPISPQEIPTVDEQHRGEIICETFLSRLSGSSYVYYKNACIRNYTSHSAESVAQYAAAKVGFSLDSEGPQVLIYHTHTTESYELADRGYFEKGSSSRTTDTQRSVAAVGRVIVDTLNKNGIEALHDDTLHDYPSYNGGYTRSRKTVGEYLEKYPSIKVVIDIHRDAIERNGKRVKPTVEINGKNAAQIMIISGCDDGTMNIPNWKDNIAFAAKLQDSVSTMYEGLARPLMFDYREYNFALSGGSLLIEVGGHANTLEEAAYSGQLIAQALTKTLKEL